MEAREQSPSPGWYPDPDQVETQRFWDGEAWTEQRAPLSGAAPKVQPNARLLTGAAGAIAAAVGVFLPRVDSPTSLHIADNSVMATDVLIGVLVLLFAAGAALAALHDQSHGKLDSRLLLAGLFVLGVAIYYGTGDRLALVTTSPAGSFLGTQQVHGSPGVGLYLIGVGGLLLALAGLFYRGNPHTERPSGS